MSVTTRTPTTLKGDQVFGNAIVLWLVFLILVCLGAGALGGYVVSRLYSASSEGKDSINAKLTE